MLIVMSDIAPLTATVRYTTLHHLIAGIVTLTLGVGIGSLASTLRMGYDINRWVNGWAIRGVMLLLTALWFIIRAFTDSLQGGYSIITWALSISPFVILWHGLPIARIPTDSAWVWRVAPYSSMILAIAVSAMCLITALIRLRHCLARGEADPDAHHYGVG
ncbi:MAG TPA: hypothetical protein EYP10_03370 [Armatimonadetes bacterium]|nr:hypothetical protein [Armatimonadota bacterium]